MYGEREESSVHFWETSVMLAYCSEEEYIQVMRSINTQETFVYFAVEAGIEDRRMDGRKSEGDPSQSD